MNRRRARIAFLLAVLAVVLALVGCSQSGGGTATKADPVKGPRNLSVGPTPAPMGRTAWSGDWSIVVSRTQRKGSVGGVPAGNGKQLIVIDFDIRNGSTHNGDVNVSSFVLTDETKAQIGSVVLQGNRYLSNNPIAVVGGTKRSFSIVYRVQNGAGPFVWRFWPSIQGAQPQPAVLAVR